MSSLIPEGWIKASLKEVGKVTSGNAFKSTQFVSTGVPVVKISNIQYGEYVEKNQEYLPLSFINEFSNFQIGSGDLLLALTRPITNGQLKVCKYPKDASTALLNQRVAKLETSKSLTQQFFEYYLRSKLFLEQVENGLSETLQPNLSPNTLTDFIVLLPPLAEQKVIADKLDELLAQVESTKARLDAIPAILKSFRQSLLAAAVSGKLTEAWRGENQIIENSKSLKIRWLSERRNNFEQLQKDLVSNGTIKRPRQFKEPIAPDTETGEVDISSEWELVSVSEFAECLDNMRIPVKKEQRESAQGLYPYFGANGEVDKVDEYIFDDELVMVTEDETFYGRVKPIAYRYSGKCWVNNHAHVLKAPNKVASDYLCYSLMYYKIIPWLSGTTGRAKLTQAALNSLPIGLPPEIEQTEIVRRVEELFALADKIEAQVNAAQLRVNNLTQSILAKAFRGELTADWRAANPELICGDNSAQALLERIKAEREALTKTTKKPAKKASTKKVKA
ncbi:restriction endonuclease subunit S [Shewanella sp. HL-SH5]|uniref:restriction endonuclease subunit S n=1 Tax=Shewanella sp. HL-SH5 TaxID=3436241 RepID=UPI003EB7FFAD